MSSDTAVLDAKNKQREAAKKKVRRATLGDLKAKRPATREIPFYVNGSESGEEPISILMVAIPPTDYDDLVGEHKPDRDDRIKQARFHIDSFAPALLARVVREPVIEEKDWQDFYTDPSWGRGEFLSLFWAADNLCNQGFDPAPLDKD